MTNDEALSMGFLSGALEVVTEKIGLDNLFNTLTRADMESGKQILRSIASQFLSEGSEETLSEFGNFAFDQIISGDLSDYNNSVREYIKGGASEKEAKQKATTDFFKQVGESFLAGGVSGLAMGGASTAYAAHNTNQSRGRAILEEKGYDWLRDLSLQVAQQDENNRANKRLQKEVNRIDNKNNTQEYLDRHPQAAAKLLDQTVSTAHKKSKSSYDQIVSTIMEKTSLQKKSANAIGRRIVKDVVNGNTYAEENYAGILDRYIFTDADNAGHSETKNRILETVKEQFEKTANEFSARQTAYMNALSGKTSTEAQNTSDETAPRGMSFMYLWRGKP